MWNGVFCHMSVLKTDDVILAGHQFYHHLQFKMCQTWEGRSKTKGHNLRRLKAFIKATRPAKTHVLLGPDQLSNDQKLV